MDEVKRDIKDIKNTQQELIECQIRMEADIAYHIKRTTLLEKMTEPMWKIFITFKYGAAFIIGLGAVVAAVAKLQGIF
jgi:hypothetical protein